MTNVTYTHTFSASSMDLIFAAVFFLRGDLLKLVPDVVCGTAIDVPIGVNTVGTISGSSYLVIVLRINIIIVPVPAIFGGVVGLPADVAPRSFWTHPVSTTAPAPAASAAQA